MASFMTREVFCPIIISVSSSVLAICAFLLMAFMNFMNSVSVQTCVFLAIWNILLHFEVSCFPRGKNRKLVFVQVLSNVIS